jgi:hypothetical protein
MAKKIGKVLRAGVTSVGTLDRGNWLKDYEICECGHHRMSHVSFEDFLTGEMKMVCDWCDCKQFTSRK